MRTTVSIEADLAEQLKRRARESEISFKAVLNDALRKGLREDGRSDSTPFVQRTSKMELRPGVDLTKANQVAEELEDSELARRLEQRR